MTQTNLQRRYKEVANWIYLVGQIQVFLWVICCGSDCRSHSCSCSSSLCVEWIWSALASSPLFILPNLHMNVWVLGWLEFLTVSSQWLSCRGQWGVWSCHMLGDNGQTSVEQVLGWGWWRETHRPTVWMWERTDPVRRVNLLPDVEINAKARAHFWNFFCINVQIH